MQNPFAITVRSACVGGSKCPLLGRVQGEICELGTWAGVIERGIDYSAGGIDADLHTYAHRSVNCVARFLRHVGQHLMDGLILSVACGRYFRRFL